MHYNLSMYFEIKLEHVTEVQIFFNRVSDFVSRVSALGIPIIGIPREKWDFTFPISQGKILKIPWEKFHFLKSHLV